MTDCGAAGVEITERLDASVLLLEGSAAAGIGLGFGFSLTGFACEAAAEAFFAAISAAARSAALAATS